MAWEPGVVGYDGFGMKIYVHQLPPVPDFGLVNVRGSELGQYDEDAVLEAGKAATP